MTQVTTSQVVKMVKDIDAHLDRTMSISLLAYDKKTLNYLIKSGYVTVYGESVTRKYHGQNYHLYVGNCN